MAWEFATPDTTTYAIEDGRGFAHPARMVGADCAGVLQRDGWALYRQFTRAAHQPCLAHFLRRCRTMRLDHPHHPFAPQIGTCCRPPSPRATAIPLGSSPRTARHRHAQDGAGATIAPTRGAHTQQVLSSVLRTAQQRGLNSTAVLVTALQARRPVVLDAFSRDRTRAHGTDRNPARTDPAVPTRQTETHQLPATLT
jgi:hypothetical protein